ncbi:hypothetical protein J4G33_10135 [Actinotalea sp. BY-33]|uniref:Uncharacterized protein n=1 Tax=Actinotalea soli TaxID=2819234 RepID=A0A939LT05_9CELL|nr:hypothetical protein [Actinotalea soli]MBO1752160.1 hypothetical protein [Actinotalea soli]
MKRFAASPQDVTPVLDAGLVAGAGVREGILIPAILVDVAARPGVKELIRVHEHFDEGDVAIAWGRGVTSKTFLYLSVRCERPFQTAFTLRFAMPKQAGIVDAMLQAHCFYLQNGPTGHLSAHLDERKLLIDIPDTGFGHEWDGIYRSAAAKMARAAGASHSESKESAGAMIAEMRRLLRLRFPDP